MSFYGSVYYQLIDAFYRMIIHNVENNSGINFPVEDSVTDEITVEAKGRKGVVNLDAGNSWIQFTHPNDETIQIWHKKPKNSNEEREDFFYGIERCTEEPEKFIELKEGDYLQTSAAYYDKAGHLIHNPDSDGKYGKYQTYYKLPVSDSTINVKNLNTLVGGINLETGEITTNAFEGTNIITKVINNESNIGEHENRMNNLETIYSNNPDKLFEGSEDEKKYLPSKNNFPTCFGSIAKLLTAWNSFINNSDNEYIKNYLSNEDNGFKEYYEEKGMGVYQIKNISSLICLIIGTIKALKQHLENQMDAAEKDAAAAQALASTSMDALGKNREETAYVFNAKYPIADALGLSDDGNSCYFSGAGKSVRNVTDDLAANKVNNSDFDNYKDEVNEVIQSLQNEISTLKNEINTLKSYHSNGNVENPEDEIIHEE